MLPGCRPLCCLLSQTLFPWVPTPRMPPEPRSFLSCCRQPGGRLGQHAWCPRVPLAQVCQHFRVHRACPQPVPCLGLQHLSYRVLEIFLCSPAGVG